MAKKSNVEKELDSEDPKLKIAPPVLDDSAWEEAKGEEYGGESTILELDEGQVAGPFVSTGIRENVDLGNSMPPVDMYEAKSSDGNNWRLPICASFTKIAEQANISRGDAFMVKRLTDQIKKNGKGKGNPMEMWAVKIITKAPVVAAPVPVTA